MNKNKPVKFPNPIFITGVDGSGKSFYAEKLIDALNKKGVPAHHLWSRFNNITSKPLLAFCRLIGLNYYEKHGDVLIGYHDFEQSSIVSQLFILLQLFDVWITTIIRIWPHIMRGHVLVCDRGAYDTLVDVMVDTKNVSLYQTIIGKAFLLLLPKSHMVLHISREHQKIFKFRPDVEIDKNFNLRYDLYETCKKAFGWEHVDNNGTPEETYKKICMELNL